MIHVKTEMQNLKVIEWWGGMVDTKDTPLHGTQVVVIGIHYTVWKNHGK